MLRRKDIFHFTYLDNMNLAIYFMVYCMMFPSANTFTFHTYLKDESIYQQKLYHKYSIPVEDMESCVTLAIDQGFDKFLFDSETIGPSNCTLCSHCPEVGKALDAEDSYDFGWKRRNRCSTKWNPPPVAWNSSKTPSFYLSFEATDCAKSFGSTSGQGKIGKGLYNPGAPSYAELVTREMYCADPDRFCWIAPDTCPNGMTLAFWMKYKGSDAKWSCIIHSAHFPSSIDTGVESNAFGLFYVTDDPRLFVYLTGNVTNGRNYYQTYVRVTLEPDIWYHVAMSFSHANGLRLCEGGTKFKSSKGYQHTTVSSQCTPNRGKMESHQFTKITGVVEFGRIPTEQGTNYMEGHLDEFVVFNEELSADDIALLATS